LICKECGALRRPLSWAATEIEKENEKNFRTALNAANGMVALY
jgi:hypothetical protein